MFKKTGLAALVLFALFALFTGGCEPVENGSGKLVKSGTERTFDYREIELANGLDVITLEDFSTPIVAVQVWYHVGSKNEDPERQGFAHMFEHMMFKGTDRVTDSEHFDLMTRVGATNNAYTSFDKTVYLETLPENQLELALWLEAERMAFLKIDQDSFDTERKVVEEELRSRHNEPYGTLMKKAAMEIFKVHPYRWMPIGELKHLRAASTGELRDFWKQYYVPNNAKLIIVGAVKHADAQRLAKKYFEWIPALPDPDRVTVREPESRAKTIVIDDENAPAPVAGMVWRTVPHGHKDEVVLDLLSEILGGGNSSRMYRELVAEKQIAVNVMATTYNLEHDGIFAAGALYIPGFDPNDILKAVAGHIEKVRLEPVTEEELEKARNQMLKSVVTQNLTINSKARMLGSAAVVKGDTSRVNTILNEIRAVTREDIQRAVQKYLMPDRAITLKVKQNVKGALAGAGEDENVPITAEREEDAPMPGRAGVIRPKEFPKKAPVAKLVNFKPTPEYSEATLSNGLKVMVVENREVPFVSVTLGFLGGAWTEEKPGTASMAAMMLTKGTTKHTEAELAEELDRYAISLGGSAGMDTCEVSSGFLSEYGERAMELLAEVVREPVFDAGEFEKLRKQVVTGLSISAQSPDYAADKEFRRRLFGDHPYARTVKGEVSDVEALTADDLKSWWGKFARADKATLIFAGDIDHDKAVKLAEKFLGEWEVKGEDWPKLGSEFAVDKGTQIYLVDRPGSPQSQIRVGQLGITRHDQPGYFVSRIVSNYFGWSFNCRLNASIRIKKGLTYSVWGSYIAQNLGGRIEVNTFSKTESTAETVKAVLEEIGRLKNEPPSDQELSDSQSYIAGSFVRNRETPQQVARDLWLIASQGLEADYLDELLEKVATTSKEDCIKLIDETVDADKLIIVVVGDAEKLAEELEKIAPVTVVQPEDKGDKPEE